MSISGKKVALLIEDEYQILEGWYPHLRLQEAGADVKVIGSGTKGSYESKEHYPMEADAAASEVSAADFVRLLVEDAGMRLLVVGENFTLGRDREGTPQRPLDLSGGEPSAPLTAAVSLAAAGGGPRLSDAQGRQARHLRHANARVHDVRAPSHSRRVRRRRQRVHGRG